MVFDVYSRLVTNDGNEASVHACDDRATLPFGARRIYKREVIRGDFTEGHAPDINPTRGTNVRCLEKLLSVGPYEVPLLLDGPANRQLVAGHPGECFEKQVQSFVHHPVAAEPEEAATTCLKILGLRRWEQGN